MKKYNTEKKNKAIVTINSTTNNTILLARDIITNDIIAQSSVGLVLKKKKGKKSVATGAQLSSEYIATKLVEQGYSSISIQVKGFGRGRESALFGLNSTNLNIENILEATPRPHNGCRLKRARRL